MSDSTGGADIRHVRRNSWITEPPFYHVQDLAEVQRLVAQFLELESVRASRHIENYRRLCADVSTSIALQDRPVLVYYNLGPKGFCAMSTTEAAGWLTIRFLVGAPGEGGVGRLLVEQAANYAVSRKDIGGKLRMIADTAPLVGIYQGWGFTHHVEPGFGGDSDVMTLDLSQKPPGWSHLGNRWYIDSAHEPAELQQLQIADASGKGCGCCVIM